MAAVYLAFGGTAWNPRLPLTFWGDALFYLAQAKSTADHGWWWFNPSLGAPFGLYAATFPQNGNVDQLIIWAVSRFGGGIGLVTNLSWIIMAALSSVTATWGLRRIGVSRTTAIVMSVLFALTPFALYRFVAHFNLVIYLLPFPATIAVLLASGDGNARWDRRGWILPLVGCALLGFNYIYYAFFGVFLVGLGALIGAVAARTWAPIRKGTLFAAVIVLTTAINFVPNVIAWQRAGRPEGITHVAAESEYYGLKIRHLVSPPDEHWFPPLQFWLDKERAANFVHDNENMTSRLGTIGAIGFVGLISVLVFPSAAAAAGAVTRARAVAWLAIAAVLLAMVGGLGSLFSLLVSPDIRAYTRISPLIAYFSIAGVAIWLDRLHTSRRAWLGPSILVAVLAAGLSDQLVVLKLYSSQMPSVQRDYDSVATMVTELERVLPANAAVFQYPIRPYPADSGDVGIGVYEHFKPYLVSRQLRWSYPAMNPDQLGWQYEVANLAAADVPRHLARAGFQAILITRAALPDRGDRFAELLEQPSAGATRLATTERFIALDLRALRQNALAAR